MKKMIIVLNVVFSICIYAQEFMLLNISDNKTAEHNNSNKVPIKLKIIIDNTKQERFILVDMQNNKKIGSIFKEVTEFKKVEESYVSKVKAENDKYGFINSDGTWLFKPMFDEARTFSKENIARVKIGDRWGFIKSDGTWLMKPTYSFVSAFANNYAFVKEDSGLFHYVNTQGKQAFEGKFSLASNFCMNQQAIVSLEKLYGRINTKGEVVEPFIHLKKSDAIDGCITSNESKMVYMYTIGRKNNHWGIMEDDELVKHFSSHIVSPLNCTDLYLLDYEIAVMVDGKGALVYFNNKAKLLYRFAPNNKGTMSLYDAKDKEIWQSNIKKVKVNSCNIEEETEEERQLTIIQSTKLQWKTPSRKICIENGGAVHKGVCFANWLDALKICKKSNKRLPTIKELEGVIMGCGGELKEDNEAEKKRNIENSAYQTCYKKAQFAPGLYWSSSYDEDFSHYIWIADFQDGSIGANLKKYKYYIQCVQ